MKSKISRENVKTYLQQLAGERPGIVWSQLAEGSEIVASGLGDRRRYVIDDVQIDQELEWGDELETLYRLLANFKPASRAAGYDHQVYFKEPDEDGVMRANFSEVIRSAKIDDHRGIVRLGDALERAILFQLACQRENVESFLVRGPWRNGSGMGDQRHHYTIMFEEELPYLVDARCGTKLGIEGIVQDRVLTEGAIQYGIEQLPRDSFRERLASLFGYAREARLKGKQ